MPDRIGSRTTVPAGDNVMAPASVLPHQDESVGRGRALVAQRRLCTVLREFRVQAGFTQDDVAAALEWSTSKILRLENGATKISRTNLQAMLSHYNVTDVDTIERMLADQRAAREPGWWNNYSSLPPRWRTFIRHEAAATRISEFQSLLVPDLLRTARYAQLVDHCGPDPFADQGYVDVAPQIRPFRVSLVTDQDGPEMRFVLDEGVLWRKIGSPEVMDEQLAVLADLVEQSRLSLTILPLDRYWDAGAPRFSFVLFDLDGPDEQTAFAPDLDGWPAPYSDSAAVNDAFEQMLSITTGRQHALDYIEHARRHVDRGKYVALAA